MRITYAILSLLVAASPVVASAASSPVYRSTAYWNQVHEQLGNRAITPRVLDKTIYPQIDAVHPISQELAASASGITLQALQGQAKIAHIKYSRRANGIAMRLFCHADIRGTAQESKCGDASK